MDITLEGTSSPFDISFSKGDLKTDDGLPTAILISLFTDRRVSAEDLPAGETSRRGWWADVYSADDKIGSRLWLLDRSKLTQETLARAREYAEEALAWIVEDGLAERVNVVTSFDRGNLVLDVACHAGNETKKLQFVQNWRGGN